MDDEKSNSFILDTSIIAPLAIAAGVVFVIVVFLYCCRNFVYNKRYLGNRGRSERVGSGRYPSPTQHSGGRRIVIQPRGRGRVSENLAAFQHHFMPWSTHRYYQRNGSEQQIPPTSTHNRANYNSTQTTARTDHEHQESVGPIPSAPQIPIVDAPPSYSTVMKFPRATATDQPYIATHIDPNAPPPPYSTAVNTH